MNWPRDSRADTASLWAQALHPLSTEEFLRDYWDQRYLFQPGQPGRFAGLLPWEELNTILDEHRLEPKRLALYREGSALDKERFLVTGDGELRINAAALSLCLADGATLVLNQVNELAPAVRRLAESFQAALGAQTTVNAYAGWKRQNGFDLHWDKQDTIILQVSGRKRWKVYGPTRLHPLRDDAAPVPEPAGEPAWDGILPDGGLLYMPRGWWHVAYPLDEPSLHLTVTIVPPNGVDLLHWLSRQLLHSALVRRNLPRFAPDEQLDAYAASLRQLVADALDGRTVRRFLQESEARLVRRTPVELPDSPAWSEAPVTVYSEVELAVENGFVLAEPVAGVLQATALGKQWECDVELEPALRLLRERGRCQVRDLTMRLSGEGQEDALLLFLNRWALRGILAVRNPHAAAVAIPAGRPDQDAPYTVSQEATERRIGDTLLIRNAATTQVLELNGPGAIIWTHLSTGGSLSGAAAALCEEYAIDAGTAAADAERVADELIAGGVLFRRKGYGE